MPLGHISEHKFIHGIKHSRFPVFFESQYISHTYMATLVCHIQLLTILILSNIVAGQFFPAEFCSFRYMIIFGWNIILPNRLTKQISQIAFIFISSNIFNFVIPQKQTTY